MDGGMKKWLKGVGLRRCCNWQLGPKWVKHERAFPFKLLHSNIVKNKSSLSVASDTFFLCIVVHMRPRL
jgi:hypothetical protein